MKINLLLTAVVAAAIAVPAQAFTFFSLGGAPDPGLASFEKSLITFDAPAAKGVTETDSGNVGLFTGTHYNAAAPAGDESQYLAVGGGSSATFNFAGFFTGKHIRSLSVYIGSVDLYNHIDILSSTGIIGTINGVDLPGNNGDRFAAITNRRLYINFADTDGVTGLRFRSDGVAFEFDTIGASSVKFAPGSQTPETLPPIAGGSASLVPEPASWALLVAGFALTGFAARRRRVTLAA